MTRPSRTGDKTSAAKGRNAGPAKGRKTTRKKRPIARAATRAKRPQASGPSEDLREAREQQAATAEILKVIASSPSDVQPVFDAIVRTAAKLFEPCSATITTLKDDKLYWGATAASSSGFDVERVRSVYPIPFDLDRAPSARAMLERRIVEIPDVASPETPEFTRKAAAAGGFRSITFVPLVDREQGIGTIIFTHPQAGFRYSERQLALIQTFADQAVIAIQNARLFNETQEALERQTATADILKVIASSPSDVQPVFEAIAERSNRLIEGLTTAVYSIVDGAIHLMAFTRTSAKADAALQASFPRPLSEASWGDRIGRGEIVEISDAEIEWAEDPALREVVRLRGFRSLLFVPLLREGTTIGIISVTRRETGTFAPNHVQLLQTFADQAVIAIENVRLFDEVQAKTRELSESLEHQTAISDILRVISSSPGDVQPVLATVAQHAAQICEAQIVDILTVKDDKLHYAAAEIGEFGRIGFGETAPINRHTVMGRSVCDKQPVHVVDLQSIDHDFPLGREYALALGHRTTLAVPLIREDRALGTILVRRAEVRPFDDRHITLLKTFADQAAIAIENARLFNEVQDRTRELSRSLDELRTAQDRLIQTEKLASLGQLTAGIAHEIKNPLNFVNNFSALSAELVGELDEALAPASLDQKTRSEVSELSLMLKSNLEKVVQHGKRADSIVKNMLLHSREGSGEHRSTDINALVEESLNLAYHGARAEKPGFNITLQRDFDLVAGKADIYPQEITRVLLNLISNGFYAATRRAAESGDRFEPTLVAATKSLGDKIEIRIRDNGTGIAADVKPKIFNPFFTTKPAGEGTGLGLSMSHDIIVKQHGGRIEVETAPGVFTEFIISLPRNAASEPSAGDKQ